MKRINTATNPIADELEEIQQELLEGLERAGQLLRSMDCAEARARAEVYWLAHARMALTRNHDYLGGCMVTMTDTIAELRQGHGDDA